MWEQATERAAGQTAGCKLQEAKWRRQTRERIVQNPESRNQNSELRTADEARGWRREREGRSAEVAAVDVLCERPVEPVDLNELPHALNRNAESRGDWREDDLGPLVGH
jgi:hypothetical protein